MISIAFTGGGTGGHIYPGIAAARAVRELLPCRMFWIGASRGMDRALVEGAGLPFFGIPAGKLRRYISPRNVTDIFRVLAGIIAAFFILKREKPALLFSKGGFVSVPPVIAAALLKIPVFTHESDYSPGLATRINLRFARRIFTAFPQTASFFPPPVRARVTQTGNPIRREFFTADAARGRAFIGVDAETPVLLVLGGSLGAKQLNDLVRDSLPALSVCFFVAHQTGAGNDREIPDGSRYRAWPFIGDEMPDVLAASTLVLCRSGAGTVWECASLGKPAVLLPLRGSGTRGDQVENARALEKAGAAVVLSADVDAGAVSAAVKALAADGPRLAAMGKAAVAFAGPDAARRIAEAIADEARAARGRAMRGRAGDAGREA